MDFSNFNSNFYVCRSYRKTIIYGILMLVSVLQLINESRDDIKIFIFPKIRHFLEQNKMRTPKRNMNKNKNKTHFATHHYYFVNEILLYRIYNGRNNVIL